MDDTATITPVLLCGGAGTRLWPLSRQCYPKQFVPLLGEQTLFQAAAERVAGPGFAKPLVVTHTDFRFIVSEQLCSAGIDPGAVILEPEGRNTAPAALAAALYLEQRQPGGGMLILPSDQTIADPAALREAAARGRPAARAGRIVTFGIWPDREETGYGYLELATPLDRGDGNADATGPYDLRGFAEKPDVGRVREMLREGRYLWNAGIFLTSARRLIEAFAEHAPDLIGPVTGAVSGARPDLGFLRLEPEAWAGSRAISIDYAVMEKSRELSVVPLSSGWSDLGDWEAVAREMGKDASGLAVSGRVTALDCRDSLLRSEDERVELVGLGLQNIIAVAAQDAVLVADASRAQDVKHAVAALRAKGAPQAVGSAKHHRPWGWFESLVTGDRFQVKRVVVHPGAALSLQSHHHRSEHWVVVVGTAKVTIGEEVSLVTENESVYIPLGTRHRLENPGKLPMVLIEVQTGAYVGEDDIIRYEDIYSRG